MADEDRVADDGEVARAPAIGGREPEAGTVAVTVHEPVAAAAALREATLRTP